MGRKKSFSESLQQVVSEWGKAEVNIAEKFAHLAKAFTDVQNESEQKQQEIEKRVRFGKRLTNHRISL